MTYLTIPYLPYRCYFQFMGRSGCPKETRGERRWAMGDRCSATGDGHPRIRARGRGMADRRSAIIGIPLCLLTYLTLPYHTYLPYRCHFQFMSPSGCPKETRNERRWAMGDRCSATGHGHPRIRARGRGMADRRSAIGNRCPLPVACGWLLVVGGEVLVDTSARSTL